MNLRHLFFVSVFALIPFAANAGELGLSSSDTVSISITVPPHVQVKIPPEQRNARGGPVCLLTEGLGSNYRTAIITPASLKTESGAVGVAAQANGLACDANGTLIGTIAGRLSTAIKPAATMWAGPMVLLIIPE